MTVTAAVIRQKGGAMARATGSRHVAARWTPKGIIGGREIHATVNTPEGNIDRRCRRRVGTTEVVTAPRRPLPAAITAAAEGAAATAIARHHHRRPHPASAVAAAAVHTRREARVAPDHRYRASIADRNLLHRLLHLRDTKLDICNVGKARVPIIPPRTL